MNKKNIRSIFVLKYDPFKCLNIRLVSGTQRINTQHNNILPL
jgi:hypothetical protein